MSPALQWFIVGALVAGATGFAVWRLLTPRLRWRALAALLACLPANTAGPVARWRAAVAGRIAADAAGGSACAACAKH